MKDAMIDQLESGKICIHPTDTILGMTCDPKNQNAVNRIYDIKGRDKEKPLLALVDSPERAFHLWQPLSKQWERVLRRAWPAPLSVIWRASTNAPDPLVKDGYIGIRVPDLKTEWVREVLEYMQMLPTTSANASGEQVISSTYELLKFGAKHTDVWYPLSDLEFSFEQSSTIIKITGHDYELIRQGAFDVKSLDL